MRLLSQPFGVRCLKILLSVYSCSPDQGSEPGVGWNWARALARRGYDVCGITRSRNKEAIERALVSIPERSRIRFIYHDTKLLRRHRPSGISANLAYALWQRSVLAVALKEHEKVHFDLVHHLTFGSWRQPSHLWRLGIPFVIGPVGGGEETPQRLISIMARPAQLMERARNGWNRLALFNPSLRRSIRAATAVAAKTHQTLQFIQQAGGKAFVALEIGIEEPASFDLKPRSSGDPLRCLYVGRLIELKGIRLALDAIALARAGGCHPTLTIVGTGPLEPQLRMLAEEKGIAQWVTFTGAMPQADVFKLYKDHDALLFPSLHDSSGNVVLEAMSFSLPVVCLALGGPGEMVDATCGLAISCDNLSPKATSEALAKAISSIELDERLRLSLADGARKQGERMTWDSAVDRVYSRIELSGKTCVAGISHSPTI